MTRSTINSRSIEGIGSIDATGTVTAAGLTVDTDTLHIDSTNNRVGIGTGSPNAILDVQAGAGADVAKIRSGSTNGTYFWQFGRNNSNGFFELGQAQGGAVTNNLVVDTAGRVGIGTAVLNNPLHVALTPNTASKTSGSAFDNGAVRLEGSLNATDAETAILVGNNDSLSAGIGFARENSVTWGTQLRFYNHSPSITTTDELTERMRIDGSGNVLVGHTAEGTWSANNSAILRPSGVATFTSTSTPPLYANRLSTNGTIVDLRKDGGTVGIIGVEGGDSIYIGNGDAGLKFSGPADVVQPFSPSAVAVRDAAISLGTSGARFNNLYLSGGVYLGGTGSANHLDDYEEGTWTPRFTDHLGNDRFSSYNLQTGHYVKIGNTCFCGMDIIGATGAVTSGPYLNIGNLPFNVKGGSNATIVFNAGYLDSIGYTTIQGAYANTSPNYIFLVASGNSYVGPGGLTSGSRMIAGFVYQTQ